MTSSPEKPKLRGWLDGLGGNSLRETRWLTPKPIVEALGTFDLDPAGAPGHDLATTTFTPENGQDGLQQDWWGRVWLNPPYGREATPFMRRMAEHGRGTMLVFATTETANWFEYVWPKATAILFLRGRLKFIPEDGSAHKGNSGKPSALIAYGNEDARILWDSTLDGQRIAL